MLKITEALMDSPSTPAIVTEEREEKSKNEALESVQSNKESKPIAVHDQAFESHIGADKCAHELQKPLPTKMLTTSPYFFRT